jgi:hypothetical protein
MDGNYPMSIVLDGLALNITLTSNAHNLDFGVVGCRRSVPRLQRLLGHLEESLTELEMVTGTARKAPAKRAPAKKAPAKKAPAKKVPAKNVGGRTRRGN